MIKQKSAPKVRPIRASVVIFETSRIITPMPDSLVAKIDREWHKRELPSRSATIRKLIEEALAK